jgi:RNA polymerase sigma factor (sigma-70 family)
MRRARLTDLILVLTYHRGRAGSPPIRMTLQLGACAARGAARLYAACGTAATWGGDGRSGRIVEGSAAVIGAEPLPETLASKAAALFRAFRAGDEGKMADLVGLLTPILWHTVRAQRVDAAAAEDVVQSTWLALVHKADSINDPQAVLQWLIVTARRESWRVVKQSERSEPADLEPEDVVVSADDLPEEMVLRSDGDARLWDHVAMLPERCRALLRVVAFADRPDYASVAKALNMPVGSIGPTRGRCLAKLRLQLANDPGWEGS